MFAKYPVPEIGGLSEITGKNFSQFMVLNCKYMKDD